MTYQDRPRPLSPDASIQERVRQLELTLYGPEEPPEPEYIDPSYRIVAPGEFQSLPPGGALDRLAALEDEIKRLKGES